MDREDRVTPDAGARVRAAAVLALPALAFLLWLARAWRVGPDLLFLPWNLFLAAVPWAAARWAMSARSRVVALAATGLWLLFLPNAPYLVTDLVHLRDREPIPHGFDVLLFSTFGLAGCVLGWASMEHVHRRVAASLGRRWAAVCMAGVVLLVGIGVYLGRFERWNSWDALTNPGLVLADLAAALTSPRAIAFALLVAAYVGAGYGFFLARELWPGAAAVREELPD